jgi:hypothetical protein
MAITYTTHVSGDTLEVHAQGFDESLEEVQNYGLAIIQACLAAGHNITRILCDERQLEYRLGTLDTYQAAEFISAQAPHVAQIAIVCAPTFIADAQFWETVAVNRGLTVRAFTDLANARRWLADT